MKRAERLHALSDVLRRSGNRGLSADRLADEFEVSIRTIKRDLAALESAGLPIWSRPGPGGGYGLVPGASLPPVNLTPTEATALLAAVAASPDAPFADLAATGVGKIIDVLDPITRQRAEKMGERVWVKRPAISPRAVRSALDQAMTDQRVVRIEYVSKSEEKSWRDVEPIWFASTGGQWFLIGWCRLRSAVRWFAVARVQKATVTAQRCEGHSIEEIGPPPAEARSVNGERR